MNLLPDARDLRRSASVMREAGHHEIAMRLDDTARYVSREERTERANTLLGDREAFLQRVTT